MARIDELRLMTKVARLCCAMHLRQMQTADQPDISQATISRLVKRAQDGQFVQIHISTPTGISSDRHVGFTRGGHPSIRARTTGLK